MLLIDSLDEFEKNTGRAGLQIQNKNLFIIKDDTLDSIIYVELLAQLIAAHSGYESKLDKNNPKIGFLVGIKDFNITEVVTVGDVIDLRIKKDYEFDQISFVTGKILCNNRIFAQGTLKLWEQSGGLNKMDKRREDNHPEKLFQPLTDTAQTIVDRMVLNQAIIENIYELNIQADKSSASALLYFSESFIGFDGHFPGTPLLPGILMMKTGLLITEIVLEKRLLVNRIKHAKFTKSVFPKQKVDLSIKIKEQDDTIHISVVITNEGEACAKFSILTHVLKNE